MYLSSKGKSKQKPPIGVLSNSHNINTIQSMIYLSLKKKIVFWKDLIESELF